MLYYAVLTTRLFCLAGVDIKQALTGTIKAELDADAALGQLAGT